MWRSTVYVLVLVISAVAVAEETITSLLAGSHFLETRWMDERVASF